MGREHLRKISVGIGGRPELVRGREEVADDGGQIQRGDVVPGPAQDSLDGEPADAKREGCLTDTSP